MSNKVHIKQTKHRCLCSWNTMQFSTLHNLLPTEELDKKGLEEALSYYLTIVPNERERCPTCLATLRKMITG